MLQIRITCEHCNASYNVDPKKLPSKIIKTKCKKCGNNIEIDCRDYFHLSQTEIDNSLVESINDKRKEIAEEELKEIDKLISTDELGVAYNYCAQLLNKRKTDELFQKQVRLKIAEIENLKSIILNNAIFNFNDGLFQEAKDQFDRLIKQFPLMKSDLQEYLLKIESEIKNDDSQKNTNVLKDRYNKKSYIGYKIVLGFVFVVLLARTTQLLYQKNFDIHRDNKVVEASQVELPETKKEKSTNQINTLSNKANESSQKVIFCASKYNASVKSVRTQDHWENSYMPFELKTKCNDICNKYCVSLGTCSAESLNAQGYRITSQYDENKEISLNFKGSKPKIANMTNKQSLECENAGLDEYMSALEKYGGDVSNRKDLGKKVENEVRKLSEKEELCYQKYGDTRFCDCRCNGRIFITEHY